MRGPHASIYLQTTRRLTSPRNYLPSPFYDLAFTLVRSCVHVLHAIPILPLLYRVPATMCYKFNNNFFLNKYFIYQLSHRPQTQNSGLSCFDFGPTTDQTQIPWALTPGPTFGVLHFAPLIFYLFGARILAQP